ncbi:hypothetical protein FQZ97_726710 [compost metagenome]
MAQRLPGGRAEREEIVERGQGSRARAIEREAFHVRARRQRREVEHLVADGHATAKRLGAAGAAEHRIRQVLDRKVAARGVGRSDPAAGAGVVRVVEFDHVQTDAISASSKIATARVQPAEAPRILCGKQLMKKPVGGSTSRLCSFSMWQ